MDGQRFDELARLIGSRATRRRVIKGALGSLAGLAFMRRGSASALTVAPPTPCTSDDDCDITEECDVEGFEVCYKVCGIDDEYCIYEQGQFAPQGAFPCCEGYFCDPETNSCQTTGGTCGEEGDDCEESEDCCGDLLCLEGGCYPLLNECETDDDCEGDQVCNGEGECVDAVEECSSDDDCSEDTICCSGSCTDAGCCSVDGVDDDHCAEGQTCVNYVCVGGNDGTCETDDDCDGLACCNGVCGNVVCPECESDADCADGICCAGECRVLDCCIDDADPNARCDDGETCFEGVCQPVEEPTPGSATVTIHLASCPTGVADIYGQCHDDGIAGVAFTVSSPDIVQIAATNTIVTDANGVASATVGIGGVTIVQDGSVAAVYLGSYIYCSEQDSGTVLYDGSADSASVSFTVADGDQVICDWYSITEAEQDDDDDEDDEDEDEDEDNVTDLPDTGTGPNGTSSLSGWLGAAALGAAAAALAGTKLRGTPEADPAE